MTSISRVRASAALLVTGGTVLSLAACQVSASSGGLDYGHLEAAISDQLSSSYQSISQQVSAIDCPTQSPAPVQGETFLCTAEVGDQKVRVEVKVTDDDYNVNFNTVDTLYDLPDTAATLSDELTSQLGFPITVNCGEGLKAVEIGKTLECTAADESGEERTVRLTASPIGENDSWELLD